MSRLWYRKPAIEWEEALPIGNGRLGAMIYGSVEREHLQLNEESIWYGGPVNRINPDMKENLEKIRNFIFSGEIKQAEKLLALAMSGCPCGQHPYQTLGDLWIAFDEELEYEEYERELDLENALSRISYRNKKDGLKYYRETICSHPADAIIIHLYGDEGCEINLDATLSRDHFFDGIKKTASNEIYLYGNLGRGGYEFAIKLRAMARDGEVKTIGEHLIVEKATDVLLVLTADCSYHLTKSEKESVILEEKTIGENEKGKSICGADKTNAEIANIIDEPSTGRDNRSIYETYELSYQKAIQSILQHRMDKVLNRAEDMSWNTLKEEHIKDYQAYFNRVSLTLNGNEAMEALPTDERLKQVEQGVEDIGFSRLYFDYGRYLLISCSRAGGLPATLQGIWNKDMTPPWDSKYTININAEMNYWPAEICGLGELHEPLLTMLKRMVPEGRKVAREMYGCRGFVAHHNTDIQGDCAPQDVWIPGTFWVMGAAWLCTHLWTHYEYTQNVDFLKEYFPIMCEAALFFVDFLVEHDGYLVTCPSVSPENTFILPNGEMGANSYGVTMDNQILRDLFNQCILAYEVLLKADVHTYDVEENIHIVGIDNVAEFIQTVQATCNRLKPTEIGSDGRILEWQEEFKEWEPGHRHISHLYGLYPSEQITVDGTPELAAAAKKTLQYRLSHGGGHTGWSRAWIINHYAKLWEAEEAYHHLTQLYAKSTYPNMFDKHPPFQIDGNFGGTAAIVEMLVQTNSERIVILPALPKAWSEGSITGICGKGNSRITIVWEENELKRLEIVAKSDLEQEVKYKDKSWKIHLKAGESRVIIYAI